MSADADLVQTQPMRRWVSHPERYPFRCLWTNQDSAGDGPYLDTGLVFYPAREVDGRIEPDRQQGQLLISPQALREAAGLPGSPIVVLPRAEHEALLSEVDRLRDEVERLQGYLVTAQKAAVESPIDAQALAEELTTALDQRYARKTGPKPKAPA